MVEAQRLMPRTLRRPPRAQARRQTFTFGPFKGMRHLTDPTASSEDHARLLRNCYTLDPHLNTRVVGRPGFALIGAQLGTSGRRTPQWIGQLTQLDGTRYTIAIVGGYVYTLNWSTEAWTEVLTDSDFSSASITFSQTARVYAVTFANELVVSDGVNVPWSWDGTTNGGLTKLTNAPVFFGQPVVHFGKLMGIDAANRSDIQWSEENQANTGYDAGNYNNVWTLGQTDTDALFRLAPSNELLYVFRARSMTAIAGAVTPEFSSTGTREAISSTVGTTSPACVFFEGNNIMFADADGNPYLLPPGGTPISYWEYFSDTIEDLDPTKVTEMEGFWDPTLELSRICFEDTAASARSKQMLIHAGGTALSPDISYAAAVFDGYEFSRIGVVENASGAPRVLHADVNGFLYVHGTRHGSTWDDNGDAIQHEVLSHYVAYSEDVEWHWDRLDFVFVSTTDLTDLVFTTTTPYGDSDSITVSDPAGFALWDEAVWDTDAWVNNANIGHNAIGVDAYGYYCVVRLQHSTASERFGLLGMKLRGEVVGSFPEMP